MSATFACPHCGTSYPVKPVLVGRAVRCTKCRNGFVLRENGIADALAMPDTAAGAAAPAAPAPAAPASATPAPAAAAPSPAASGRATAQAAPIPSPAASGRATAQAAPDAAAKPGTDRQPRLNKQQEEMRRAMAGTLANAAAAVLKASATPEEAEAEAAAAPKSSHRMAKASTGRHAKPKSSGILVVGAGEQDARTARRFWISCAAVCLALVALVVLVGWRSAPRRALDAFAAPVYGASGRYPQLLGEMQRRAWISDGLVLVDLGSVRMGVTSHFDVGAATAVLSGLKDKPYFYAYALYADAPSEVKIAKLWAAKKPRETNLQKVRDAKIDIQSIEDVQEQLSAAGLKPDAVALVLQLLHPSLGSPQMDAERLSKGEVPAAVELMEFHGVKGTELFNDGRRYLYPAVNYHGRLLRFIGQGWPSEWRVLDLATE